MTLEQLVKAMEGVTSMWGMPSVSDLRGGLEDALRRIQALEKKAKPK